MDFLQGWYARLTEAAGDDPDTIIDLGLSLRRVFQARYNQQAETERRHRQACETRYGVAEDWLDARIQDFENLPESNRTALITWLLIGDQIKRAS